MKPSWFKLEEIKKHTERSYNPGESLPKKQGKLVATKLKVARG